MGPVGTSNELLDNILSRALALLDEETKALRDGRAVEHSSFIARKSMIAFELDAIARMPRAAEPDEGARRQLRQLRAKLEENRSLLEVHISACKEIAKILADAVRSADWDGTYTALQAKRGKDA